MTENNYGLIFKSIWLLTIFFVAACSPTIQPSQIPFTPSTLQPSLPSEMPAPEITPTPAVLPTRTLEYIDVMPRSWNRYARFNWKHDGLPFESEHVTVYSDDSGAATKERFALETEKALERIVTGFGIGAEGGFVSINLSNIEVFISSKRQNDVDWEGYGHYGGFLVVYDKGDYRRRIDQETGQFPYTYLVTHELTHVIVLRILGNREYGSLPIPRWFHEGLATYMGVPPLPIRTLQLFDIAVRDKKSNFWFYNYHLDELMVYYLIETYGMENVIGILFDMRGMNLTFEEAFENRTGLSADEYLDNFDSSIREFFATQ